MNAESYPISAIFAGDISCPPGSVIVEVVGLQTVPIAPQPYIDGYVPTYVSLNGDIEWEPGNRVLSAILVNGNPVSQDSLILVNNHFILAGGYLGVLVNGTRIV
jgi:hypothetical protein